MQFHSKPFSRGPSCPRRVALYLFSWVDSYADVGSESEIAESGSRVEGQQLQAILINVTCELRDAVNDLREAHPEGTFIDGYGIQTTLTLTYEEKGALGPSVNWFPPSPASAVFNIGAGLNLSSDATRKERDRRVLSGQRSQECALLGCRTPQMERFSCRAI